MAASRARQVAAKGSRSPSPALARGHRPALAGSPPWLSTTAWSSTSVRRTGCHPPLRRGSRQRPPGRTAGVGKTTVARSTAVVGRWPRPGWPGPRSRRRRPGHGRMREGALGARAPCPPGSVRQLQPIPLDLLTGLVLDLGRDPAVGAAQSEQTGRSERFQSSAVKRW